MSILSDDLKSSARALPVFFLALFLCAFSASAELSLEIAGGDRPMCPDCIQLDLYEVVNPSLGVIGDAASMPFSAGMFSRVFVKEFPWELSASIQRYGENEVFMDLRGFPAGFWRRMAVGWDRPQGPQTIEEFREFVGLVHTKAARIFSEVRRVLKPGGEFYVFFSGAPHTPEDIARLYAEHLGLAKEAGFSVELFSDGTAFGVPRTFGLRLRRDQNFSCIQALLLNSRLP